MREHSDSSNPTKSQLTGLITILQDVPDPRDTAFIDHDLPDILTVALCTILCGGESFYDMETFGEVRLPWLKTFLRMRNGAPRHDTYNRVFQSLDPKKFGDALVRWTQSARAVLGGEVVALDGKALRRALNKGQDARVIVSAWATGSGLLLGQRKVRDKSNEITAVPELLQALELAGCIVTADALHCQKNIAREIIEADAHYVLALKGNQARAFTEVKTFLDDAIERKEPHLTSAQTTDKGHGRIEVRRCWQSDQIQWFEDREKWEGLRTFGVVESRRTLNGKESVERRYYLSSLNNNAQELARAVRGHWSVENQLHWVLDVIFGEDQSRARTGHAAENLAQTRRLAINLLRQDKTSKRSIKGRLLNAAIDPDYLQSILKI